MKANKKIVFLSVALAATIPLSSVIADEVITSIPTTNSATVQQIPQGNSEQVRVNLKNQRQEGQRPGQVLERQQNIQEKCQGIQTRLNGKINQVQNNKKNLGIAFTNLRSRLQRLSERLGSKGYDVTKLNQDIATLDTKINKLNQDHDAFLTGLQASLSQAPQACGTTQGQFMSAIASSRSLVKTVEQDRLDIKNFYQTTIKSDLMTIRGQVEKQDDSEKIKSAESETQATSDKKIAK